MPPDLFHVSEDSTIERFEPRLPPAANNSGITGMVVWAVDDSRLHNYLLPRDCPRVTFYSSTDSTSEDVERLLGPTLPRAVVAIESNWFARVMETTLHLYALPTETFECQDRGAGYWVSRLALEPVGRTTVPNCVQAIAERGVELRILPTLWPLRDAVLNSTLGYSFIRMRNAQSRNARS